MVSNFRCLRVTFNERTFVKRVTFVLLKKGTLYFALGTFS